MIKPFGKTRDNREARLYTLENRNGMSVSVTEYAAATVSLRVPDKAGNLVDILLGFDDVTGYERTRTAMGATIGRHSGQIWHAEFELGGKVYHLDKNSQGHSMHGGPKGFHTRMFSLESHGEEALTFIYLSPDGESGFPGNLEVKVTYRLSDENELFIDFHGLCDRDTILSMTNHAYFNLNGPGADSAMDHELKIYADQYAGLDEQGVPTGEVFPVEGSVYDFRDFHPIGERIDAPDRGLIENKGYDHYWFTSSVRDGVLRPCCEMRSPSTGIHMQLFTDQPGALMYSGNYLNGSEIGKAGAAYGSRSGICLEAQICANGLRIPHFPSPILRAGEEYRHKTVYRFVR